MPPNAAAFDSAAATYDADFTHTIIGAWLRARAHDWLGAQFRAGDSVLELGCGTGEDARFLAEHGVHVTATDASLAMLEVAHARLADTPLATTAHLDMINLPAGDLPGPFVGAFASFGPLNVLADHGPLAGWLAARIRPGGLVMLGMMGPLCPWEIGWHALHGDLCIALRRFRRDTVYTPSSGSPIAIHYPSSRRLVAEWSPWFRRVSVRGLGVFLPPSDLYGLLDKRPRLRRGLMTLEIHLAGRWPFIYLGDHYWITLVRR